MFAASGRDPCKAIRRSPTQARRCDAAARIQVPSRALSPSATASIRSLCKLSRAIIRARPRMNPRSGVWLRKTTMTRAPAGTPRKPSVVIAQHLRQPGRFDRTVLDETITVDHRRRIVNMCSLSSGRPRARSEATDITTDVFQRHLRLVRHRRLKGQAGGVIGFDQQDIRVNAVQQLSASTRSGGP